MPPKRKSKGVDNETLQDGGENGMMVNLPRNESFENKSDVHLIMQYSQATNKKTTQNF